eukprot:g1057.t1
MFRGKGIYYLGRIERADVEGNKFEIKYDDGDSETGVPLKHLASPIDPYELEVDVFAGMSTYAKKAVADYNRSKGVPVEEKTREDDHVVVVSSTPYKGATSKLATSTDGMVNIQGTYYDQDAMDSLNSSSHASHVTNSVTSITDSETKESPHRFNDGGEAICSKRA